MNRDSKQITTTLPEPLSSSASITTNEHPYMRIDIPPLPLEESEHTALPVDEAHTIPVANSRKTPPKPRVSLVAEVDYLLAQAMVDASSCKSEHSPIVKVATVEAVTSPSQKPEASPQLVEEAEASLEVLPANISPIAAAYSSRSASAPVDPTELQTDTSRATNNVLHLKRSTDLKRQRVIWELGVLLHQSEVNEAASVSKAKVIHLWEVLDAKVGCSRSVLEANCNY